MADAETKTVREQTVRELLAHARSALAGHSDSAGLDAELLLAQLLDKPRSFLYAWPDHMPTTTVAERFGSAIAERAQGQPVAYTLGNKEFFGLELAVSPAVLIPRPDTELLVECVLDAMPVDASDCVVDLGTGSGAIALAVAAHRRRAQIIATDISAEALLVATANARLHALDVAFARASWTTGLRDASVDWLLANPPYIAEDDPHLPGLAAEPSGALVGGVDGLDALRAIIADASRVLRPGGRVLLEHGFDQASAVRGLLAAAGLCDIFSRCDLGDNERVSGARRPT